MVSWRTLVRIALETFGEAIIIFVVIILERLISSKESSKHKKVICAIILLLMGVGLRIYADQITIAIEEDRLWEIITRWN